MKVPLKNKSNKKYRPTMKSVIVMLFLLFIVYVFVDIGIGLTENMSGYEGLIDRCGLRHYIGLDTEQCI